ncbi:MAG: helix-turn-helix transcriptional regulator [Cardiobacteriaceae bacterium]|nr:helix-turn-helix transcriptional regulator [Cardiobacteriaceae bacterium]
MKNPSSSEIFLESRQRFARNLRTLRRLKDISQEQLAHDAGISRAYLGDVERANRAVTIDVMGKLAQALHVDLALLLQENPLLDLQNLATAIKTDPERK